MGKCFINMTQIIFIQIGQCGNQVGRKFWDVALKELKKYNIKVDEENSFFRLENESSKDVKARAILVDMEEGVIKETLRSTLGNIFDTKQLVTDVSGSGNNWAVGHHVYGKLYKEKIKKLIQNEVEKCDNLKCFFLLHSMGGGTGSGLGTAILDLLHEEYPKVQKFVFAIYPSSCDDVVTSPYNAVLANNELIEKADCVFPIENEALVKMSSFIENSVNNTVKSILSTTYKHPFDQINEVVANLILNLTASARFPGSLNVDLNEIVLNLVPYQRLHYITSCMTPLTCKTSIQKQSMTQLFSDLLSPCHCFLVGEVRRSICLACAAIFRGDIHLSDVQKTVDKLQNGLRYVPWNKDCFKIGLCNVPPLDHTFSAVMLTNSSCVTRSFIRLKSRFQRMYNKKAHLHHFLQIDDIEQDDFNSSLHNLDVLIDEYSTMQYAKYVEEPRLKVLV